MLHVRHAGIGLNPDSSRLLLRSFNPTTEQRSQKIVARIVSQTEAEVCAQLKQTLSEFSSRHRNLQAFLMKRFEQVKYVMLTDASLSEERKLLIGAYFTQEYALEGAALFNPSMVWHPDQSGVPEGSRRFIISLRATGEGHISSITFRAGIVDAQNQITLDDTTPYVTSPDLVSNPTYERDLFERKLYELNHWDDFSTSVLASLNPQFTLEELKTSLRIIERQLRKRHPDTLVASNSLLTLAQANYIISYSQNQPISERVIFPTSPTEINGIEDARFVQFQEDCGRVVYYATYTAYDGKVTMPQMLKTEDFLHFEMSTLNGPEIQNKGMALFPRRIHGQYAMLSRQDNENIFIMFSDNLHFWYTKELILRPTFPWEYVQLGNCGSPIETESGWLVLMHGVGPMRKYVIGAVLLDRDNPARIIGRLRDPIISPVPGYKEGYVANVVYSCGAQIHNDDLILPYAMADYASAFAIIPVAEILEAMR